MAHEEIPDDSDDENLLLNLGADEDAEPTEEEIEEAEIQRQLDTEPTEEEIEEAELERRLEEPL